MNGSAPNVPATGSQVDVTTKRHPNVRIARNDSHASATTSPAASATTLHAAARNPQENSRSPDRPREMPTGTEDGDSPSAVVAPGAGPADIGPFPIAPPAAAS